MITDKKELTNFITNYNRIGINKKTALKTYITTLYTINPKINITIKMLVNLSYLRTHTLKQRTKLILEITPQ